MGYPRPLAPPRHQQHKDPYLCLESIGKGHCFFTGLAIAGVVPEEGLEEVALLFELLLPPLPDQLVVLPEFPLVDLLLHFGHLLGLQRLLDDKVGEHMQDKFVHEVVANVRAVFEVDPQEPDCIGLLYLSQQLH